MKQLTFIKAGLLEWHEAKLPTLQADTDVLVRPLAVARCDLDFAAIAGRAPLPGPYAIGHEFIAEIVEMGDSVSSLNLGQKVIVPFQISCGKCRYCLRGFTGSCLAVPPMSMYGMPSNRGFWGGAMSDLVRVPFAENMLVKVPEGIEPKNIASLSDNIVDGWRTVAPYLSNIVEAEVLIVGGGALSVGLYAAAIAVALGAKRVDYIDHDKTRLDIAQSVGANPIDDKAYKQAGSYQITVDASANVDGLKCAICCTEPEGICTSVGIYFSESTPLPLNHMFYKGITFKTGRANSRAGIPHVLELINSGKLRPEKLTTKLATWDDAAEAFKDPSAKVVVAR
ncbi:MAG: alcohol dehydrogenase catalytic domain-containing protein [Blastocatellia bacterium]|nr:alcohol dehydrogenase catalytic domain-containing protein [Blastocatellia bacterium]